MNNGPALIGEARDALNNIMMAVQNVEGKVDAIAEALTLMAEQGKRMQQEGLLAMMKGTGLQQ